MPLLNPSFDDAGLHPGEAAHWALVTFVSAERIAGFGPEPYRAWEDFERWSELKVELNSGDVAIAFFDLMSVGFEDFENAWGNDGYLFELSMGQVMACPFGQGNVEGFERGWNNDDKFIAWSSVTSTTAVFDGEPVENFEDAWRSNESFAFEWSVVLSERALFDAAANGHEDFENGWPAARTI